MTSAKLSFTHVFKIFSTPFLTKSVF